MSAYPDKIKLWEALLEQFEERVGFEQFNLLHNKAYLDSVEEGHALIGVKSGNWIEILERKRVVPVLASILSDIMICSITVKLVVGRPRIINRPIRKEMKPPINDIDWSDPVLGALHEQYQGDIMGIVDNHPTFVQATSPIQQGGWGIFPKILTNACKDYGVLTVLNGLTDIAHDPHVTRPRACFLANLKNGIYGHRLAKGASIIGPIG